MRSRSLGSLLIVALSALCVPDAGAATRQSVTSVSKPPKALKAGQSFKVTTTVKGKAKGKTVTFYLSTNTKVGLADPELAGVRKVGKATRAKTSVTVPEAIPGGTYRVLACLGRSCRASGSCR